MNRYSCTIILLFLFGELYAQNNPAWDDVTKSEWTNCYKVEIKSSLDDVMQKAYVYKSNRPNRPLIVSLHTWSGNYEQKDPLLAEVIKADVNYIHPDFRGPNRTPLAMGSKYVISDIEDAVRFAVVETGANPDDVHIVGVSGGGYATLLSYMNIKYPVKSFSAWAPISDIKAWYWESLGRGQKYAKDIQAAIPKGEGIDEEEAVRRSPLYHSFDKKLRKDAKLFIYEGVHDGYKGSVPISHAIYMYNRIVTDWAYGVSDWNEVMDVADKDKRMVSRDELLDIIIKRLNPKAQSSNQLFGRNIHIQRKLGNVELIIFEGRHEQIPEALELIPFEK